MTHVPPQQRLQKMQAIGQLAGKVAHDFNNILTSVIGNISLARLYCTTDPDKATAKLDSAEDALMKARDLTSLLGMLSTVKSPELVRCSLASLIKQAVGQALMECQVTPEYDLDPSGEVMANEAQLMGALQQVVLNARQAMGGQGKVRIASSAISLEEGNHLALPAGDYVRIRVADHGPGIPPEHRESVFEPFFTTYDDHYGLGLGIAYAALLQHKGGMAVGSPKAGDGTVMELYLPLAQV